MLLICFTLFCFACTQYRKAKDGLADRCRGGIHAGYILIDMGGSNSRKELVTGLESAGCKPGLLKLIVLTHRDFDHTGSAAHLRNMFGRKIAMY